MLLLGAMFTGWLAIRTIDISVKETRIKEDTGQPLAGTEKIESLMSKIFISPNEDSCRIGPTLIRFPIRSG